MALMFCEYIYDSDDIEQDYMLVPFANLLDFVCYICIFLGVWSCIEWVRLKYMCWKLKVQYTLCFNTMWSL